MGVQALDVAGLPPSFAASLSLAALRFQRPVGPLPDEVHRIMQHRDPLLVSTFSPVEAGNAVVAGGSIDQGILTLTHGTSRCTLRTRDVLATDSPGVWMLPEEAASAEGGYWVAERDVIDAVLRLSTNVGAMDLELCGRRWWGRSEYLRELELLRERVAAGQAGAFTTSVLSRSQAPSILVQPAGPSVEVEPDIAPLHRALVEVDGEGWRPRLTLREAVMYGLALQHAPSGEQI